MILNFSGSKPVSFLLTIEKASFNSSTDEFLVRSIETPLYIKHLDVADAESLPLAFVIVAESPRTKTVSFKNLDLSFLAILTLELKIVFSALVFITGHSTSAPFVPTLYEPRILFVTALVTALVLSGSNICGISVIVPEPDEGLYSFQFSLLAQENKDLLSYAPLAVLDPTENTPTSDISYLGVEYISAVNTI